MAAMNIKIYLVRTLVHTSRHACALVSYDTKPTLIHKEENNFVNWKAYTTSHASSNQTHTRIRSLTDMILLDTYAAQWTGVNTTQTWLAHHKAFP